MCIRDRWKLFRCYVWWYLVAGCSGTDGRVVGNTQCHCVSPESRNRSLLSVQFGDILQRSSHGMYIRWNQPVISLIICGVSSSVWWTESHSHITQVAFLSEMTYYVSSRTLSHTYLGGDWVLQLLSAETCIQCIVCLLVHHALARAAPAYTIDFYSMPKRRFASAVYATANPSVHLSVHHTPVLCQNEGTQRDVIFTIG